MLARVKILLYATDTIHNELSLAERFFPALIAAIFVSILLPKNIEFMISRIDRSYRKRIEANHNAINSVSERDASR